MASVPEPIESKKSEGWASVLNVVPSLYYDLIARICPGLAFWLGLAASLKGSFEIGDLASLVPENIFVLIVLSYVSGIVLSGFGMLWDALSFAIISRYTSWRQAAGLDSPGAFTDKWKEVARRMEAIAKKENEAGRTVTKMLAEVALCENLLSGVLVLVAIRLLSDGCLFLPLIALLLLLVTLLFSVVFRQMMFLGRVEVLYFMHVEPKAEDPSGN